MSECAQQQSPTRDPFQTLAVYLHKFVHGIRCLVDLRLELEFTDGGEKVELGEASGEVVARHVETANLVGLKRQRLSNL